MRRDDADHGSAQAERTPAGLKRLAFTAKSGKPKRERDVIKLRCLPPA